jgi:phage terminase large subunit
VAAARRVVIPYAPRRAFLPLHQRTERFGVVVAHRRAGKTVAAINDLIRAVLSCPNPNPRAAYLAPYYAQAKDVVWNYLKHYTASIPGVMTNESELRVDLPNGGRVRLYGADNYDRLRGIYLDDVVLDEYADMDPRAWSQVIRPALADREGRALFIGTPKGRNAFWKLYDDAQADPEWFSMRLRASETGILPQAELDKMRATMSEDEYARELETSFEAAIEGAYYARVLTEAETDKRIGNVPHDPGLEVHAAWDLGIGDSTVIWCAQFVGREVRLIDYIENNGVALDWYARELRNKPYTYAPLILPHDAQARELGTGKSRVEMLEGLGFRTRIAPKLSVEDGIEAVRRLIPRMWIDERRCDAGLKAIRDYRERRDEKRRVSLGPLHDWTSHAADALRYLAVAYNEPRLKQETPRRPVHSGGNAWMGR